MWQDFISTTIPKEPYVSKKDSEFKKITVKPSKDMPPEYCGMTSVVRLTAVCDDDGKELTVGHALLCIPTEASQANQGHLILDINTNARDMDEVTEAILHEICGLALKAEFKVKPNIKIAFKYDGNLAEKLDWVKKSPGDGMFLFFMSPVI